jgi:hypothetical protein
MAFTAYMSKEESFSDPVFEVSWNNQARLSVIWVGLPETGRFSAATEILEG